MRVHFERLQQARWKNGLQPQGTPSTTRLAISEGTGAERQYLRWAPMVCLHVADYRSTPSRKKNSVSC